jgi:hypothetical protein
MILLPVDRAIQLLIRGVSVTRAAEVGVAGLSFKILVRQALTETYIVIQTKFFET